METDEPDSAAEAEEMLSALNQFHRLSAVSGFDLCSISAFPLAAWWKRGSQFLHCALSLAAQCIVIGPVCGFVYLYACVCVWVCYRDNSKLRASASPNWVCR